MALTEQQNITRYQKAGKINRDLNSIEQSCIFDRNLIATVAQLVEQLIRNERVGGSSPLGGSILLPIILLQK